MVGHGEGVAGGAGVASGGEVVGEVGVVTGEAGKSEPAFVAAHFELGFVGEDSRLSAPFPGGDGELSTGVGQEEGGLVASSGDGVVGDGDAVEVAEGGHDGGGGRPVLSTS